VKGIETYSEKTNIATDSSTPAYSSGDEKCNRSTPADFIATSSLFFVNSQKVNRDASIVIKGKSCVSHKGKRKSRYNINLPQEGLLEDIKTSRVSMNCVTRRKTDINNNTRR
jgi:hypothetical protein